MDLTALPVRNNTYTQSCERVLNVLYTAHVYVYMYTCAIYMYACICIYNYVCIDVYMCNTCTVYVLYQYRYVVAADKLHHRAHIHGEYNGCISCVLNHRGWGWREWPCALADYCRHAVKHSIRGYHLCKKKQKTMSLSAELRSGSRKKQKASSYSAMYYCT